jgi:peptide/nickel transport system permease protein
LVSYLARRLLLSFLVVFIVITIAFFMLYLAGDPVLAYLSTVAASQEQIDALRHTLGYDRPLFVQYFDYLANIARLDFGDSLRYAQPTMTLALERIPYTLQLTGAGLAVMLLIAVPVGILSAVYRGTMIDRLGILITVFAQSIPSFVVGPVLILVVAVWLGWLPAAGSGSIAHLILPAITLALYPAARVARILRGSMLDALNREYVTTARAKGLSLNRIVWGHVVRNASVPVLTVIGLQLQAMLGGAVVVETIFGWPGIGQFAVQALLNSDFQLIRTIVLLSAVATVFVNLVVDMLYAAIDPRIRYS